MAPLAIVVCVGQGAFLLLALAVSQRLALLLAEVDTSGQCADAKRRVPTVPR